MEGNTNKVKTNHPGLDEIFFRDVIEETRKNPKQQIALFANNLTNPAYEGKVMESILCARECCQVVSQGEKNKSNIELIKEYLYSNDESSRENAAGIIKNLFSKENIGTVSKSETFMIDLLRLLKDIAKNGSLKDEAMGIIKNLFSKENIDTVLNLVVMNLPSLLEAIVKNKSLKDEAKYIIKNLFSEKNIGTVLESYSFVYNLPSLLEAIVKNKSLKDEARYTIRNIFSKKNIGIVLESERFMKNLPSLLEAMIKNKSFENGVKYIIKNISSYKNLGSILNTVDTSLGRSVSRDIVKGLAKEMLKKKYKDFEKKATNFIEELLSTKGALSMSEEMLNYGNKTEDSASDFMRNILENDSVPEQLKEQLKSDLKALKDDFSKEKRKFLADALIEKRGKTRNRKLAVFQREE